jgi:hypothetical protein
MHGAVRIEPTAETAGTCRSVETIVVKDSLHDEIKIVHDRIDPEGYKVDRGRLEFGEDA